MGRHRNIDTQDKWRGYDNRFQLKTGRRVDEMTTRLFAALADPVRRHMIEQLTRGPQPISQLTQPLLISRPAISKHLRLLEGAGLIKRQKKGRQVFVALRPERLKTAEQWFTYHKKFWNSTLNNLGRALKDNS